LDSSRRDEDKKEEEENKEDEGSIFSPVFVQDMIHLSPICIAFSTQLVDGQDTRVDTLIPVGSPLPWKIWTI
jgi:hypothetical protein